ncbi:Ca2+-binding protein, EF-hand superfamily [Roseivivax lentus]|uniref:Ca2+-binding protein, EF-hand superfamily n=1 Tax=Roseivivax lentus TaxID=633194 RepID=A0A1N7PPA9_9RHOB|nr:EF-hand domain-containing protein [Roseivivax lentus]SIT12350.1 Ca2+-binding protein, EF-hand superfamily [Roseivivax lentus]
MIHGTFTTSLLIAALAGGAAFAHPPEMRGADGLRGPSFEMLDADADGQLTEAELAAQAAARFAERDSDGDGQLSVAEILAHRQAAQAERIARRIARLDQNGDGALSYAEITAWRDPAAMFDRLDADADGAVSAEEFAALEKRRGGRGHGRPGHGQGPGARQD